MNDEQARPKAVKFVYTKSDDYKTVYVNGVFGGLTRTGEVSLELFQEHGHSFRTETHRVEEDGRLGPRIELEHEVEQSPDEPAIIREKKVKIILHPDHAESIAEWMLQKVQQSREIQKAKADKEYENGSRC